MESESIYENYSALESVSFKLEVQSKRKLYSEASRHLDIRFAKAFLLSEVQDQIIISEMSKCESTWQNCLKSC